MDLERIPLPPFMPSQHLDLGTSGKGDFYVKKACTRYDVTGGNLFQPTWS